MVQITRRDVLTGAAASGLAIPGAATAQSTDTIKMAVGAAQVVTVDPMRLNQGIDNWAITNVHDLLARAPTGDFAKTSADFMPELATAWEAIAGWEDLVLQASPGCIVPQRLWRVHVRRRKIFLRPAA